MYCNFYIAKANRNCKKNSNEQYNINNLLYCKIHYLSIINSNNENYENTKKTETNNTEINKCIYKMKTNSICNKKSNNIYNSQSYCSRHYKTILLIKKRDIVTKIKNIENINITTDNKNIIKKDIYNILRDIHPDKCKIPDFDSHVMTQKLTNVLEKLKL